MKRSLVLVFVVVTAFVTVFSLTALFSVPAVQAVPIDVDGAAIYSKQEKQLDVPLVSADPFITLQKSPSYYDAANVAIDMVNSVLIDEYAAWDRYKIGDFDTIPLPADLISDVNNSPHSSELVATTQVGTYYYGFSTDVPPFDDPLVRAAFASALDRAQLISATKQVGLPSTLTFTPPGAFGYVDGYTEGIGWPYDPSTAVSLLATSGYSGVPTITIMVNDYDMHIDVAKAAQQTWFDVLGISVTLKVKPWDEYLDLLNNGAAADRPGIYRLGWVADYPDANNFLNDALGSNISRYENPAYEGLVFEAATEMNPTTRLDLYKQAESLLVMTDTVVAPIYNYVRYDVTRPTLNRTYRPFAGEHVAEWDFPAPEILDVVWGEPWTLDPAFADNSMIQNYINQLFLGLTEFDSATNAVVPKLATSWTNSPEGRVYTFTLRSDAFWTDGNPVTAYDVKYGIERTLNPGTGADFGAYLLNGIKSILVLDATHIQFELHEPTPYFPMLLATGPARPLPQWIVETYGDDWTRPENIVSNGPYELVAWEAAPHVRVELIDDGPPAEGSNLGLRVQYWNDGGAPADDVVITDTLLSGMTFITDTAPFPSNGTGVGNDPLVWNLGTLAPYSFGEFEVFVQVTAVQSDFISSSVQITTATPGDLSTPEEREFLWDGFVMANQTDLKLPVHPELPFVVGPGSDLTYLLNAINGTGDPPNDTPATASSYVTLSSTLHPSLTLQSWWSRDGLYWDFSDMGQTLIWERPSFTGFGNSEIYVVVHVDENAPPGLEISMAGAITTSNDLDPVNNQTILTDTVVDYADLMITMTDDPGPVVQGNSLTYTLTVDNNGPVAATNVVLTDTLPAGSIFIDAFPVCGEIAGIVTCNLDTIPSQGTAFVTVVLQPTIPGEAFNFAEVAASEYDPDKTNNAFGLGTAVLESVAIPVITGVQPGYGSNDQVTNLTVTGYNFQSGAVVSLDGTELLTTTFYSDYELWAEVGPGLTPGTYDVWVTNPDSGEAVFLNGFTVLENQSPEVTAVSPSQGPYSVPVTIDIFGANFAPGGFASLYSSTDSAELGLIFIDDAHLRAVVPSFLPTGVYTIEVSNPDESAGLLANAYEVIAPINTDLYAGTLDFWKSPLSIRQGSTITPQIGLNVHRQGGLVTLPSVDVEFRLGSPGGTLIGQSSAFLLAPNGLQTTIPLAWTPPGAGTFTLYAIIDPGDDVAEIDETNNIVSRMITVLPPLPADVTPPTISDFAVNDGAASTDLAQVSLDVTAIDNSGGSGVQSILYVEYEYVQSAGGWNPVRVSDWLPYADAHLDYAWALIPSPGVHYLQAWVADAAGNVSAPVSRFISYQPDFISISAGQVHVYRRTHSAGDGLQVRLTILDGGTTDLYVWAPDATKLAEFDDVTSFQDFEFTADQDGVFQIEVEGVTGAQYQLEIIPITAPADNPLALDGILRARSTPFMLPSDEPGDDVGLPEAPSNVTTIFLPVVMKN